MRRAIYEDDVIKLLDKGWKSGAYPVASNIHALPSAQPDFDTVEKIDKAYNDGYKCGYLQAKSDYEAEMRGEQE